MSLDALVFCDCFERGRLVIPPEYEGALFVRAEGDLELRTSDVEASVAFDEWRKGACEHEGGVLATEYLGNIARVFGLRTYLESLATRPAFLLTRVVHNGVHAGNRIEVAELPKLQAELSLLGASRVRALRELHAQLQRLIAAASTVGKPIVF